MRFFNNVLLISLILITGLTLQAQTEFKALLSGSHEVLPVATTASGEITAVLNGNELQVSGTFSDLIGAFDPTIAGGSHIHIGYAGQNGNIAISLTATPNLDLRSGTYEATLNTFTLTQDQMDALMERRMYVNIHTTMYAGGEIRGQLLPASDAYFNANLLGSNEVPSVITSASGALVLELSGNQLVVTGAFSGLESAFNTAIGGGAHLHLGLAGENGSVEIAINANPDPDLRGGVFEAVSNTFTLTDDQIQALASGQLYANIHSADNAGGEIRGQVVGEADLVMRAHLSGANEIPVVTSGASGAVIAELRGDSLIVSGSFDNLESEVATEIAGGAHIHIGMAGQNGEVLFPLVATLDADDLGGTFDAANNRFELTADQKAMLLARGMYVNIHTMNNTSGEIRGQLLPDAQAVFTGLLSGTFEVPAIVSRGRGAVKAELIGNQLIVSGAFDNLGSEINVAIAGGAHIHLGPAGTNGDVIYSLNISPNLELTGGEFEASANTFTLTEAQIDAIRERGLYVNVHSLNFASGELRGQLLAEANYYMNAPLSGASETANVNTNGRGTVILEVTGNQAIATGGFSGLQSDFNTNVAGGAHIHAGFAGQSGGVIFPLNASVNADNRSGVILISDNTIDMSAGQLDTLRNRMFYVNIHSVDNPPGEIRGQCLPVATAYLTTSLAGLNEVQPKMSMADGALKLELNGDVLTATGAFSGLQGDFAANIAGGAHLHLGSAGSNGDIDISLVTSASMDLRSGIYSASDNTFDLSESQIDALVNGDYYANIHTTAYTSGELRGQVLPEINFFPTVGEITLPLDGATILIEGAASTLFQPTWTAGEDANDLVYIWQLAADADFNSIILQQNVGGNLSLSTTFGAVDTLLAGAGVTIGASATLYHRVLASDGSLSTASEASNVTLTRGMVTSTNDLTPGLSEFTVFPTVANNLVNVRIGTEESVDAQILMLDNNGRQLAQRRLKLNGKNMVNEQFNVNNLPAGTYYLSIRNNNSIATRHFIVK